MQSKWGNEDPETLVVLNKFILDGQVLNVAAGDGRFTNILLKTAEKVMAIDLDEAELKNLSANCPDELKTKLLTKVVDITKELPFENAIFDGLFCTGTLHLFDLKTIEFIINQMKRVLKQHGKIIFDFATDIRRVKKDGSLITFDGEGHYTLEQAKNLFETILNDFDIKIEDAVCVEEDLNLNGVNYDFSCKFLIVSGHKN